MGKVVCLSLWRADDSQWRILSEMDQWSDSPEVASYETLFVPPCENDTFNFLFTSVLIYSQFIYNPLSSLVLHQFAYLVK